MQRQRILAFIALLVLTFGTVCGVRLFNDSTAIVYANTPLIVSAAASLTNVMKDLAPLYQQTHPNQSVRYNFGSSGALQQQIENGAPADVFISAAEKQMDALQQKDLLASGTRRKLLTNRLVLVVPASATSGITSLKSLTDNRVKRIAIGDPRSVPAGQYAEQALTKAGVWNQLKAKYVLATNVRQVLQFVEAGNADAGLVYLTDAKTTNKVKIVQTIPSTLHAPIGYPIAVLKNSRNPELSRSFVNFLFSGTARKVFTKYGFTVA